MTRTILVALTVFGLSIAAQPITAHAQKAAAKASTVAGTAKSVTTESLVVSSAGKDMTFHVDGTTTLPNGALAVKPVYAAADNAGAGLPTGATRRSDGSSRRPRPAPRRRAPGT